MRLALNTQDWKLEMIMMHSHTHKNMCMFMYVSAAHCMISSVCCQDILTVWFFFFMNSTYWHLLRSLAQA